jgi:ABC-2 type transport system ATP-binding protein
VITAELLTRRYGRTTAVDALSFTVRPGLVTGFLGPNGSGKSTTMRLVLGLERPDEGSVTVGGRAYARSGAPLHDVGALLDARALHPGRSAHAHLLSLAQTHGIGRGRVREVLELVGLEHVAHRPAGTFSLGTGQRLGLAAALLGDPAVLLLDEPVNGLDPDGILWIRTLLRSLAAQGRTVLVSSHLMSEMALTADHLLVLARGRLLADAPVARVLAQSDRAAVRVRSPGADALAHALRRRGAAVRVDDDGALSVRGADAAAVGDAALALGVPLHELATSVPSLEEAFLD